MWRIKYDCGASPPVPCKRYATTKNEAYRQLRLVEENKYNTNITMQKWCMAWVPYALEGDWEEVKI